MSDLISRSELLEKLEEHIEYNEFDYYKEEPLINMSFERLEEIICSQPTVEAKPVVHEKWVYDKRKDRIYCDCCNNYAPLAWNETSCEISELISDFCPNCGCDMRKKVE